jgi:hypothetical protein
MHPAGGPVLARRVYHVHRRGAIGAGTQLHGARQPRHCAGICQCRATHPAPRNALALPTHHPDTMTPQTLGRNGLGARRGVSAGSRFPAGLFKRTLFVGTASELGLKPLASRGAPRSRAAASIRADAETKLPWQAAMSEVKKRRDINSIMIIGAGPIVIGQVRGSVRPRASPRPQPTTPLPARRRASSTIRARRPASRSSRWPGAGRGGVAGAVITRVFGAPAGRRATASSCSTPTR